MALDQVVVLAGRVAATIGWTLVGVLIFYAGTRLYDLLDPIDYVAAIKQGNVAAAIKLGAVTLGLAAIVVAAIVT
jgi:uncharacterized membrane protein YjfL (UPF0719 family)